MLSTPATQLLGITHPVVQAGMARRYTNAELVAAVSGAGGLGVLGCLNRPAEEAVTEVRRIRTMTDRPFGLNFVVEHLDETAFEACLGERVPVYTFFRGDPRRVVPRVHAVGAAVVYQVTTPEEAKAALEAGADMLVAQGSEAGGHVGPIPLLALLPAVVGQAEGRPVLAAGGIVDGPSLAAALCLGAAGAWVGTRFLATPEAPVPASYKRAIVDAVVGATVRTGIWDAIWGRPWPGVEVRALRNPVLDRWVGREQEVPAARAEIVAGLDRAWTADDATELALLAGEGSGRISAVTPAAEVVDAFVRDAAQVLRELATAQ